MPLADLVRLAAVIEVNVARAHRVAECYPTQPPLQKGRRKTGFSMISLNRLLFLIVVTTLGCGGKSVEMPKKIALPPTEPATFSQRPDLGKQQ